MEREFYFVHAGDDERRKKRRKTWRRRPYFLWMRRRMGNIELIPTQCKTVDSSWQGAALVSAEAFRQPPWKPQNSCIIKNIPFEFNSNFYSEWKV